VKELVLIKDREIDEEMSLVRLSCVATVVFRVRLLYAVAFSKKLPWFEQIKL